MKIKDVIAQLQKYPEDTEVILLEKTPPLGDREQLEPVGIHHRDFEVVLDTSTVNGSVALRFDRFEFPQDVNYFAKLTALQEHVGYKKYELSPVALLGLFGEAGEVLNEVSFWDVTYEGDRELLTPCNELEVLKHKAVSIAEQLDGFKKRIRGFPGLIKVSVDTEKSGGTALFDMEVADQLYYLNLAAFGRGHRLDYYAKLSYDKVVAKLETKKEESK